MDTLRINCGWKGAIAQAAVMAAIRADKSVEKTMCLIARRRRDVNTTEDVTKAAMKAACSVEIMRFLVYRGDQGP